MGTHFLTERKETRKMAIKRTQLVSTEKIYIKTDRHGTKHYRVDACPKCEGTGKYRLTTIDDFRCWKCHESGYFPHIVKEYTPEYLEKQRQKNFAKHLSDNLKNLPRNLKTYTPFISMEQPIYAVKGNTYPIREALKAKGARWAFHLRTWVFDKPTSEYETIEIKFDDICELNEHNVPQCKDEALDALANRLKAE